MCLGEREREIWQGGTKETRTAVGWGKRPEAMGARNGSRFAFGCWWSTRAKRLSCEWGWNSSSATNLASCPPLPRTRCNARTARQGCGNNSKAPDQCKPTWREICFCPFKLSQSVKWQEGNPRSCSGGAVGRAASRLSWMERSPPPPSPRVATHSVNAAFHGGPGCEVYHSHPRHCRREEPDSSHQQQQPLTMDMGRVRVPRRGGRRCKVATETGSGSPYFGQWNLA